MRLFLVLHPFGEVPALILSERKNRGTNIRLSSIIKVTEVAKDLARDKIYINLSTNSKRLSNTH
jgi:RNA polymerase-interacting CarD/CdnL/TRCF family regulator